MATLSTHTLNGVDGTHAGGIGVTLVKLAEAGAELIFETETDAGGRLRREIPADQIDTAATYELVMDTAAYWATQAAAAPTAGHIRQIVLRFEMSDAEGAYHMPVILGPNTYSTWLSH
ncbi:hydroxyisourate hydrolase [Shimia sediminis]|uniref:hydroxyisourate hydrolase n=1 Tax=Shimia sediminis TaxID=2497945 RepID=UPI000F8C97E6|nr:hydroxyisourate hydrolase [Shimia sediminis]